MFDDEIKNQAINKNSDIKELKKDLYKVCKSICKIIFKAQNIIIYVLTFLISMVSIKNEVLPFGLAIIAACLGTEIPIAVVFGLSSISTFAFHGISGFGTFFFTCLVYFLSVILFKPKYSIEERNEIVKTGGKLFFACFTSTVLSAKNNIFLAQLCSVNILAIDIAVLLKVFNIINLRITITI